MKDRNSNYNTRSNLSKNSGKNALERDADNTHRRASGWISQLVHHHSARNNDFEKEEEAASKCY